MPPKVDPSATTSGQLADFVLILIAVLTMFITAVTGQHLISGMSDGKNHGTKSHYTSGLLHP